MPAGVVAVVGEMVMNEGPLTKPLKVIGLPELAIEIYCAAGAGRPAA